MITYYDKALPSERCAAIIVDGEHVYTSTRETPSDIWPASIEVDPRHVDALKTVLYACAARSHIDAGSEVTRELGIARLRERGV